MKNDNREKSRYFTKSKVYCWAIASAVNLMLVGILEAHECGDVKDYGYQIIYLNGVKSQNDIALNEDGEVFDQDFVVDGVFFEAETIRFEPYMTYAAAISALNSKLNSIGAHAFLEGDRIILKSLSTGSNSSAYIIYFNMFKYYFNDYLSVGGVYNGGQVNTECSLVELSNLKSSFESDFGAWSSIGEFDLLRKSGSTPSVNTGPAGAPQGSYYVYLETSSGSAYSEGDVAVLESSAFNLPNSDAEIQFKYHMYGEDMGSIFLEIHAEGNWHQLWSYGGQSQSASESLWSDAWVRIPGSYDGNAKLRFRFVAAGGYRGDIAIDDINIRSSETPIAVEYVYDALGRLRLVKENGVVKEGYKYDRAGNFCDVAPEDISTNDYCE